jgi:hypothetical protein
LEWWRRNGRITENVDGKVIKEIYVSENSSRRISIESRGVYLVEGKGKLQGIVRRIVF